MAVIALAIIVVPASYGISEVETLSLPTWRDEQSGRPDAVLNKKNSPAEPTLKVSVQGDVQDERRSHREEERREFEIKAQRASIVWARMSFFLSAFGAAFGAISAWLLFRTYMATKDGLKLQHQNNEAQRKSSAAVLMPGDYWENGGPKLSLFFDNVGLNTAIMLGWRYESACEQPNRDLFIHNLRGCKPLGGLVRVDKRSNGLPIEAQPGHSVVYGLLLYVDNHDIPYATYFRFDKKDEHWEPYAGTSWHGARQRWDWQKVKEENPNLDR